MGSIYVLERLGVFSEQHGPHKSSLQLALREENRRSDHAATG